MDITTSECIWVGWVTVDVRGGSWEGMDFLSIGLIMFPESCQHKAIQSQQVLRAVESEQWGVCVKVVLEGEGPGEKELRK